MQFMNVLKYFSMFRGISGFEKGIEQAHERYFERRGEFIPQCAGYSEVDRYACSVTKYHYPNHHNYGDATKLILGDIADFDLLCAGFPCQAFSIAGQRKGFADTRGTLFFEIERVLNNKRPAHFLLENVEGLRSHDNGKTFQAILRVLTELGYFLEVVLLNSKHHGVPQNRQRVYFIGHFADRCRREIFPFRTGDECNIGAGDDTGYFHGILHNRADASFPIIGNDTGEYLRIGTIRAYNVHGGFVENKDGTSPTITTQGHQGVYDGLRMRYLTPVECERLQGFPDDWTRYGRFENDEVREISDRQRYRMCGNAVTVNVIDAITTQLLEKGCLA